MLLPSVEGHAAGNWIVVDSGVYLICKSIYGLIYLLFVIF